VKDLSEQSHYEVLELAPGCAADMLLKAYALAKERYGPGALSTYALGEPGEAEALLQRVEEAFAVLSDPERRQAYDSAGGFPAVSWERPTEQPFVPPPVAEAPAPAPADVVANEPAQTTSEPPPQSAALDSQPVGERNAAPETPPSEAAAESPPKLMPEPVPTQEPREEPVAAKAEPEHKPVRKTESELPADSVVTGEALRRVREARGLTLKDVENRTKIGHWHLENIERERYDDLPAQVYLRGFLMSLARELKLDPVRVARSYLEQMKAKPQAKSE
jgi:hypothetical protein